MNVSGPEHVKLQLANQRLAEDNARLRKLIADAEWEGNTMQEPEPACPWCQTDKSLGPIGKPPGEHEPDCPAFSAPGTVR